MCCYKIDTGSRHTIVVFIQVATTCKALSKFGQHTVFTSPKITHTITVASIPFCPTLGEFTPLVTAFSYIPGFCNQFYLRDNRILVNNIKKSTQPVHSMQLTCKGGGKIKTETIYMHF